MSRCRRCSTASWRKTPFEQLNNVPFIARDHAGDVLAFAIVVRHRPWLIRGAIGEATIAALAGGYGNIGYMGPGLALATLGAQAAAPVALIFCFDTLLLFSLVPFLMALAGAEHDERRRDRARGRQADRAASAS